MQKTNPYAQSNALAYGKIAKAVAAEGPAAALVPHRVFEGNRPSNSILAQRRTHATLSALLEHSFFTQGVIRGIDLFDQWATELGKVLTQRVLPELAATNETRLEHDSSTNT